MKVHTAKTIAVPFESWFFLKEEQHRQRSETGKRLDKKRWRTLFDGDAIRSCPMKGCKLLSDGDFGGCNGSPVHAWEEHRWTSWTLDDMKVMLDRAGLPWKDGECIECIDVTL